MHTSEFLDLAPIPESDTLLFDGYIDLIPDADQAAAAGYASITTPYDLDDTADRLAYENTAADLERLNRCGRRIAITVRVNPVSHHVEFWRLATTIKNTNP